MKTVRLCLVFAASLSLASPTAMAADSTDPAVLAAQQAQAIAEARKAAAEADLATAKARLGEVTQPLPTGAGTATNLNIEGKLLAYRAADKAADQIAAAIRAALAAQTPPRLVFLSVKEVANISLLQAFNQQASLLLEQVSQLEIPKDIPRLCPKPGAVFQPQVTFPPGVAIDAALTLLRLFKTDRTLVGEDVTLDDFAILALLVSKLGGIEVVYPPSYFPDALVLWALQRSTTNSTSSSKPSSPLQISRNASPPRSKRSRIERHKPGRTRHAWQYLMPMPPDSKSSPTG